MSIINRRQVWYNIQENDFILIARNSDMNYDDVDNDDLLGIGYGNKCWYYPQLTHLLMGIDYGLIYIGEFD